MSLRLRRRSFEVRTVARWWGLEQGASDNCLKPIELDEPFEKIIIAYRDVGTAS